ncbi:MAG: SdiA-regulated domain-containing protein [Ferruginibacter sp.]
MKLSLLKYPAIFLLFIGVSASCKNTAKKNDNKTPAGYDLNNPEKFNMPGSLLEISGISFYNGNPDTVYAIQDEEGRIFRVGLGVKKQVNSKFGKKGDYEDVSILGNKIIVLKSNGTLFSFDKAAIVNEDIDSVQEWKGLVPEGEYEGMYGDAGKSLLYVLCKNCQGDNGTGKVSGYILQLGDSIKPAGSFSISKTEMQQLSGKSNTDFRPSALAQNPVTGEWFILSGTNKILAITDAAWKVKEAYRLNGNTFNQAEGIAFDTSGNLYISNEGDDLIDGNILRFKRN